MFKHKKVLKFLNRAVYLMSAVMMMAGLLLTVTAQPASADPLGKVYICHASVEDGIINYVTLEISENAVYGGHFNEDGSQKESHELDYLGACATTIPVGETPLPTITPNTLFVTLQTPYCVSVPGDLMQWAVVNNNAEPFTVESWSIDGVMQELGFIAPVGVSLLTQTSLDMHTIVLNWEQEGTTFLEWSIETCAIPGTATLIPTATTVPVDLTPEEDVTICHAAGLDNTLQYVTLNIGWSAVYGSGGHFNLDGTPKAGHENDYLGACATVTPTTVPVVATPVPDTATPTATYTATNTATATLTNTPTITPNLLFVTLPQPYCVSMPGTLMQWTVVNNNAAAFTVESWSIDGVIQPYGFVAPVGISLLAQTSLGTHTIVLNWEQEGTASLQWTIASCALPNTATFTPTNTAVPVLNTPVNTATLAPLNTIVPVVNTPVTNIATTVATLSIPKTGETAVPVTNISTTVPTLSIPKTSGTEIPIIPVTGADLSQSVNGWFFGGFGMFGFGLVLSGLRKMFAL